MSFRLSCSFGFVCLVVACGPKAPQHAFDPTGVENGHGWFCSKAADAPDTVCHRTEAECVDFLHVPCTPQPQASCFVVLGTQSAAGTPIPPESFCYVNAVQCEQHSASYYRSRAKGDRTTECGVVN